MATHEKHITAKTHLKVFVALIALTVITVIAPHLDLYWMATPVAFLIATIKACLVLFFFMHLIHDEKLNVVIIGSSFFFLMLFLFFSALDIFTRVPEVSTL